MNIVIAGFGVAGATAAETARKHNPKAYITLFSKEKDLFYYRPRLPEVVSGDLAPDKVFAHSLDWYRERNIELRLGESLAEIHTQGKIIRGSTGSRQTYDRLLLAVGAESNRLSFPGDKLDGIFAVRSLNDAWSLNYYAQGKKKAVLIGGGLLGLELGYALTRHGLQVTVLEMGDRILPRQTTPRSAELLRKELGALGLEFRLRCQADRFEGARQVENVVLKDGSDLAADIVLISAGVIPNLSLATTLGLKMDRAIVVDEYLRTSEPDIFAAGDCVQYPGAVGGLWTTSRAQGLVAGANIAAADPAGMTKYEPEPPASTLKVAGIDLVAAGNIDCDDLLAGVEAATESTYRKVVVDSESRLIGFTNVGTTLGNRELQKALTAKKVISPSTLEALASPEFDFAGF
ncbi:FAD-dependent oxidoreductase [Deltaproteobacteria bacterium OttesenSCG-928-M10]|nr:FAD-dependent oxidoreductase [Deltaproteobacteria bacterium OttesenSCG-928-M10]